MEEIKDLRIGVVGGGVVGRAVARCWLEWVKEVCVFDVLRERSTHSLFKVLECDLVFVCLPTPQVEGGMGYDLSAIENFFYVGNCAKTNLVLRSTVSIGTTRKLRLKYDLPSIVHSPEFLTARCSVTDAQMPARNIIGGPPCRANSLLTDMYRQRFPGIPLIHCGSEESEAIKLFTNGFFAVKLAYFNEIRAVADKLGLDWDVVIQGILTDGRIAHAHTRVPGHDGKYGFSGGCLPKDLASLIATIQETLGEDGAPVTKGAYQRNLADRVRKVSHDD